MLNIKKYCDCFMSDVRRCIRMNGAQLVVNSERMREEESNTLFVS